MKSVKNQIEREAKGQTRHSLAMGFQSSFADIIIRKTHERARTMSHLGFLFAKPRRPSDTNHKATAFS